MSVLPLLLRFWREAAIVVLALALIGSCHARDHRIAASAVAKEQSRQADSTLRVVTPRLARVDTLFVHDTVVVRPTLARIITLRDTVLQHLTDTVLVREYVTSSDSAAHACTDLLNDCAQFRIDATASIAAWKAKALAAPQIVVKSCTQGEVVSGVLGVAVGYLGRRYQEKR